MKWILIALQGGALVIIVASVLLWNIPGVPQWLLLIAGFFALFAFLQTLEGLLVREKEPGE